MKAIVILLTIALSLPFLFELGCATKNVAIHPGAVNAFDSQAYDTLVTIQAAIEQASKEITAYPNLKPELNKAIDGYNAAQAAYKAYHEAALAGKPADQAALDATIKALSTAVAGIVSKLHPAAPVKPVAALVWRLA